VCICVCVGMGMGVDRCVDGGLGMLNVWRHSFILDIR
jgi:hypothetical protein